MKRLTKSGPRDLKVDAERYASLQASQSQKEAERRGRLEVESKTEEQAEIRRN